jgi:hypothetical protein
MCNNKDIQELLPAYLEQGVDPTERLRVDQHLEVCADCRAEIALLRMMTEEPVPDPGEDFWSSLPDTIYREVGRQQPRGKRRFTLPELSWTHIPGWTWATAVVCVVALASWFMLRPAAVDVYPIAQTADETGLSLDPENMEQLSPAEIDAATQWAQNQLASIGPVLESEAPVARDNDLFDELLGLNGQELEMLDMLLKNKGQKFPSEPSEPSQSSRTAHTLG